jgi:hypothetical protein
MALGEQMLGKQFAYVQDLGSLPIPPSMWSDGMGQYITLGITGKTPTGTDTVSVDWLQIFPSGAGRYRVLEGLTTLNFSTNDEVVDDGPNGSVYVNDALLAKKLPWFRPLYDPIYLWPNLTQRLRLIVDGGNLFEAAQAWGVSVAYRPRRLTL